MTMNEEDFQFIISRFLLRDETSETPKIHPKKIEESKTAIQNKLANYIEQLENNEIEVELEDYKSALKQLKKMKSAEYEEVVMEIVENFQQFNKKRTKIFPSASASYPEQVIQRTIASLSKKEDFPLSKSKEEAAHHEAKKDKATSLFSDFPWHQGKRKDEK